MIDHSIQRVLEVKNTPESESWDQVADIYNWEINDRPENLHRAILYPTILRMLGDVQSLQAVDMGSGNGALSNMMLKQGAKAIHALDFSTRMLAYSKQMNNGLPIKHVHADLRRPLNLKDDAFDCVVQSNILQSLETTEELQHLANETYRVLKPGGICICSIPYGQLMPSRFYENSYIWPNGIKTGFKPHKLQDIAQAFLLNERMVIIDMREPTLSQEWEGQMDPEKFSRLSTNSIFTVIKIRKLI